MYMQINNEKNKILSWTWKEEETYSFRSIVHK